MSQVWHAKNPTFGLTPQSFPNDYELVATVESEDLGEVFRLTNHIDCEWWLNDGVYTHKQSRSTSVGDVVEISGKFFLCEMMGWKEFTP